MIREYYLTVASFGSTAKTHVQEIRKRLLKHFFPRNALAKNKRAMRRMMRNPRGVKLRQFSARLKESKIYPPSFQDQKNPVISPNNS